MINTEVISKELIKVVIVGDAATGKTQFLNYILQKQFVTEYIPTIGADVHQLTIQTTTGPISFEFWDAAGQDKYAGQRGKNYIGAVVCIIFFAVNRRITYKNVPYWYNQAQKMCRDVPIKDVPCILIGNKIDDVYREVKPEVIKYPAQKNIPYFELSIKDNINCDEPIQELCRIITRDPKLQLLGKEKEQVYVVQQNVQVKKLIDIYGALSTERQNILIEQLEKLVNEQKLSKTDDELKAIFSQADQNKTDGSVDCLYKIELYKFLVKQGLYGKKDKAVELEELTKIMKKYDKSGDGKVGLQEFMELMRQEYKW